MLRILQSHAILNVLFIMFTLKRTKVNNYLTPIVKWFYTLLTTDNNKRIDDRLSDEM